MAGDGAPGVFVYRTNILTDAVIPNLIWLRHRPRGLQPCYLDRKIADTMKRGVISSALKLGFDSKLYLPSPEGERCITFGKYINLVERLKDRGLVSRGKYEELLLDGFRGDIVYGLGSQKEKYD